MRTTAIGEHARVLFLISTIAIRSPSAKRNSIRGIAGDEVASINLFACCCVLRRPMRFSPLGRTCAFCFAGRPRSHERLSYGTLHCKSAIPGHCDNRGAICMQHLPDNGATMLEARWILDNHFNNEVGRGPKERANGTTCLMSRALLARKTPNLSCSWATCAVCAPKRQPSRYGKAASNLVWTCSTLWSVVWPG